MKSTDLQPDHVRKNPLDQLLAQTMSHKIQPVSDSQLILFA